MPVAHAQNWYMAHPRAGQPARPEDLVDLPHLATSYYAIEPDPDDVAAMIDSADRYTPTPAVSHAILTYNRGRSDALADGIVVTPSHNPPSDGGFKYNPPHGGPADTDVTGWVEREANALLERGLGDVPRVPFEDAAVTRRDY